MLVDGRATILDSRIRQLAYDTIKQTWPRSLGLLALSRLAMELESDMGLLWPMIAGEGNTIGIRMFLDFRDAEDFEFRKRVWEYSKTKSIPDLHQKAEIVTPDLTEYFIDFPVERPTKGSS